MTGPLAGMGLLTAARFRSGFGRLVEDFPVIDVKESPGDERATTDAAIAYLKAEQPDLLLYAIHPPIHLIINIHMKI